ncbi:RNA polymerase sigma factor [Hymenobacter sp. BT730]|uniref:RNA polymerase sigma factor n=1 Tax=Hymenobacter sp. BT730 TaxID=3063332 RepID=UPI0026E0B04B|nr:hypothetical protein [Hymenobacter sp. BT730]
MSPVEESTLVQRMTAREPAALAAFYDHYGVALYRVILGIVHRPLLAEAVLQESLIHLSFSLTRYDATRDRLFPWTVRLCCDQARDSLHPR